MIIEDDWYGKFGTCIACGYVHETQIADPSEILEEERLAAGKTEALDLDILPGLVRH